jgi:hypothetical protein
MGDQQKFFNNRVRANLNMKIIGSEHGNFGIKVYGIREYNSSNYSWMK